jgi:hypothetical protein
MIEGEDVEIGSDSDVSDTSQISINHVRKLTYIFLASYLTLIGMSYESKKNAHL